MSPPKLSAKGLLTGDHRGELVCSLSWLSCSTFDRTSAGMVKFSSRAVTSLKLLTTMTVDTSNGVRALYIHEVGVTCREQNNTDVRAFVLDLQPAAYVCRARSPPAGWTSVRCHYTEKGLAGALLVSWDIHQRTGSQHGRLFCYGPVSRCQAETAPRVHQSCRRLQQGTQQVCISCINVCISSGRTIQFTVRM